MSVAKELLKKIKLMFDAMPPIDAPAPAPAAPTTKTVKTTDGVEIVVDKLEAGGIAMINGVAAPANTYMLDDGSSLTTDATGKITAVTPAVAPVNQAAPTPAPAPAPVPAPTAPLMKMVAEMKFDADGMNTLFAKFATGTADERIANLELVCKALMQYNFGYEMRQAQEKADRDAAIAVFQNDLSVAKAQMKSQKEIMSEVTKLVEAFVDQPQGEVPGEGRKKKFSFSQVTGGNEKEVKGKKGIDRFRAAAEKLSEGTKETAN